MRYAIPTCQMQHDAAEEKLTNKTQASYTLEGTVLENGESIKYLGVTITNDLKWNTLISNFCTNANRTHGFLRRTLFSCSQDVKEAAYKGVQCVQSWSMQARSGILTMVVRVNDELEQVQKRAEVEGQGTPSAILSFWRWKSA